MGEPTAGTQPRSCAQCGGEFRPARRTSRYCSLACLHASMRRSEERRCRHCGRSFARKPWQFNRDESRTTTFCSRACAAAAQRGRRRIDPTVAIERTCGTCGTAFLVGGTTGVSRRRRHCSPLCLAQARNRATAPARLLPTVTAAYLAGMIDSVGRVALYSRGPTTAVRVRVRAPNPQLAQWLMDVTGIGHLHTNRVSRWNWWCSGEAAASVLRQVLTYLVAKRPQAEVAIEAQEGVRDPARRGNVAWLSDVRQRMAELNATL